MYYSGKNKTELISLCKEKKIKGYSGRNKHEIISLLSLQDALFRTKSNELCKYKYWQDHLTSTIIKLFIKETSMEDFAKLKSMSM